MLKQAVILAAGEGNRLRPFTANKPKAMLFIAGRPVLQYVIEALVQAGVRDLVLVVGYRREQIFDYFGSGEKFGATINYVTQLKQLGTSDALAQARDAVHDQFLVLSGDKLIEASTIAEFVNVQAEAALVKRVDNPYRHGVMDVADGLVQDIQEQPAQPKSNLASTRIYSFSKDIFSYLKAGLLIADALSAMISEGKEIHAHETGGPWLDIIYPWDILSLNALILPKVKPNIGGMIESGVYLKGPVAVGKDTVIHANSTIMGPAVIGHGCQIGPNACVLPSTSIGDNVIVSPFSVIKDSVIGSDVNIGSGSAIQSSVIDRGCIIGVNFTACSGEAMVQINGEHHQVRMGAMIGEGCNIGSCVVAQPGVIVGNYIQVQALKIISGKLPDKSLVL